MDILREKTVTYLHQIFHHHQQPDDEQKKLVTIPFVKMLALTTCRHGISLQKIIKKFVIKKIPGKNIILHTILLTATAELLFMNSPDYAVINDYVDIAKKQCGNFSAGFINAVLRHIAKQKNEIKKTTTKNNFNQTER